MSFNPVKKREEEKRGKKRRTEQNTPQLKMLASFQRQLRLCLARRTFQPQHHLLGRLGFLLEHRFGLTAISGLLAVISSFSLGE